MLIRNLTTMSIGLGLHKAAVVQLKGSTELLEDHPAAAVARTADVEQTGQAPSLKGVEGFSMPAMDGYMGIYG